MADASTNAAARAIATLKANGSSSRQRGHEKAVEAVSWVYRWGYSVPKIIDDLSGIVGRGLCTKLIKKGFLVKTISECGRYQLITLTPNGQEMALEHIDRLIPSPYTKEPERINQLLVRHNLTVQRVILSLLKSSAISDYISDYENRTGSTSGIKQPDAFGLQEKKTIYVIEVELSPKFERDLDQFVERSVRILEKNAGCVLLLYTKSPAIIRRYKQAFNFGEFPVWEKINQRWEITCTKRCDADELAGRIQCKLLPKSLLPF